MSYKPGAQYRVQIDAVMTCTYWGDCLRVDGVTLAPAHLAVLNATVTEIAPPEPPVGSIWRSAAPHTSVDLLERCQTSAPEGKTWWNHTARTLHSWDEVRALPGFLVYTPDGEQ